MEGFLVPGSEFQVRTGSGSGFKVPGSDREPEHERRTVNAEPQNLNEDEPGTWNLERGTLSRAGEFKRATGIRQSQY